MSIYVAIMKDDAILLGTSLKLERGQKVKMVAASNLPDCFGKYFAKPLDGKWSDGIDRNGDDSILIEMNNVHSMYEMTHLGYSWD